MKKILMAATAVLALAGNSVMAQENTGGNNASESTVGGVGVGTIAAGAVGLAIAGAIVSNNRGNSNTVVDPIDPTCGDGETLVDGECVPSTTTTVTSTVTTSVTSTMTTPVTVTATTTSL